ncbi:hypothetical protein ACFT5C_04030 [Streptomyces sp. NPDC057116]
MRSGSRIPTAGGAYVVTEAHPPVRDRSSTGRPRTDESARLAES